MGCIDDKIDAAPNAAHKFFSRTKGMVSMVFRSKHAESVSSTPGLMLSSISD